MTVAASGDLRELRLFPTEIRDCAVHRAGRDAAAWSRERMCARSAAFDTTFERDGTDLVVRLGG